MVVALPQDDHPSYTFEQLESIYPTRPVAALPTPPAADGAPQQDEYARTLRYQKWLQAIPVEDVPAPGGGKRNGWYYAKLAYGTNDLGLPSEVAAQEIWIISEKWHRGASYEYDKCLEIAQNAARHGRHRPHRNARTASLVSLEE